SRRRAPSGAGLGRTMMTACTCWTGQSSTAEPGSGQRYNVATADQGLLSRARRNRRVQSPAARLAAVEQHGLASLSGRLGRALGRYGRPEISISNQGRPFIPQAFTSVLEA